MRNSTPDDTSLTTDAKVETALKENGEEKIDSPAQPPAEKNNDTTGPPPTPDAEQDLSSKKRVREENDDGTEEAGVAKKVDTRGEKS